MRQADLLGGLSSCRSWPGGGSAAHGDDVACILATKGTDLVCYFAECKLWSRVEMGVVSDGAGEESDGNLPVCEEEGKGGLGSCRENLMILNLP